MHILEIIHGYPPAYNAGSEVYTRTVARAFSKRGHRVSIFTREENEYDLDFSLRHQKREEESDLYLVNLPREKDGYDHPRINDLLADLLDDLQPEVAHIGHLNHLSTGLVEVLNARKIPILFTLHDFWLMCPRGQFLQRNFDGEHLYKLCDRQENRKCAQSCYRMYHSGSPARDSKDLDYWTDWVGHRMEATREVVRKVDLFHAPSQYLRDRFIRNFQIPEEKILYLDYGFPLENLPPANRTGEKNLFTFGYIGTHIPAKGVNHLIEAFSRMEQTACLKIWGRPLGQNTRYLEKLAAQCRHSVEFLGEYPNEEIASRVFSQVDCIVVPSIWTENSPLVIHEAQACRLPVITADVGGMAELVQHQVNGLLFRHRDVESLAKQLEFACQNPKYMAKLGTRGYLKNPSGQVPSIDEHIEALENIFLQLTQNLSYGSPTLANND